MYRISIVQEILGEVYCAVAEDNNRRLFFLMFLTSTIKKFDPMTDRHEAELTFVW